MQAAERACVVRAEMQFGGMPLAKIRETGIVIPYSLFYEALQNLEERIVDLETFKPRKAQL